MAAVAAVTGPTADADAYAAVCCEVCMVMLPLWLCHQGAGVHVPSMTLVLVSVRRRRRTGFIIIVEGMQGALDWVTIT